MLGGQTVYALTYHRQVLELSAVMDDKRKAKYTIREQSGLLKKVDCKLFGSSFRKHVAETAKAKKESKEVYRDHQRDLKRPFRKGSSFSRQQQNGGQTGMFTKRFDQYFKKDGGNFRGLNGKNKCFNESSLPQQNLSAIQQDSPDIITNVQLDKVHPWIKMLFKNSSIKEYPLAERLQYFVKNWQIVTKNSQILQWVSGLDLQFSILQSQIHTRIRQN